MALAVIIAARKLRPYFDCHPIQVLTNQPLEKALQKMDSSGRLLKWAVELSEYDIQYKPRTAIKAQALADFMVEASYEKKRIEQKESWLLEVDGSAADSGSGAGEWFSELVAYKLTGVLPSNPFAAKKLRRQANWYIIYRDELYRKSFSLPLLKCATAWEAKKILEEIHEGICGNHIGGKALALKALRAGSTGQPCWRMLRAM
ncbi:uncharacterized protein LOC130591808 [Beta vulgaris subsp. vulgaris]|uniref:uncharacterized protein LOC130591808 n=1 Tax=Beta vulgaris subsp. vulgaris TaxID=3555 RepID=UPI002546C213|nr:uncharacterized protein LOC130591808 [Beta vulgaris subsp. vulgaris]